MRITTALFVVAGLVAPVFAQGSGETGPSTTASAYTIPSDPSSGVRIVSIATTLSSEFHNNLDSGLLNYRMVGIPDGAGVYRDGDDMLNNTFTIVMNHELGDNSGIARAHGNRGAFVSQWKVSRSNFSVQGGRDLSTTSRLFDMNTNAFTSFNTGSPMPDYNQTALNPQGWDAVNSDGFSRFCSADLAAVGAYQWTNPLDSTTYGTADRIFLNGEERGDSGRAFAHVATGTFARTSYELPDLADFSWENSVACPFSQRKTIVAGLDDSTPGQIYFYVGDKQTTGNVVEKAGLMGGKTYGMLVPSAPLVEAAAPITGAFQLVDLSASQRGAGVTFNTLSSSSITSWGRPEDGAWNPSNPNEFIWVNTGATVNGVPVPTRLYKATFTDITNPEAGGVITMLAQGNDLSSFAGGFTSATGATTVAMGDNIAISHFNQVIIQEDVGANDRLGRIWLYDMNLDSIVEIGTADPYFFGDFDPAPGFQTRLTRDEEASGIVDARDSIGPGWWIFDMQAHYGIPGELTEGGQLLAMFIPGTACDSIDFNNDGSIYDPCDIDTFLSIFGEGPCKACGQ